MDSIGQLAGGIAHDFNNLLAAIIGNIELGIQAIVAGGTARAELEEIRKVAQRAANLTRQLLAFARRQTIEPQELNINDLILDMDHMLRHLIGPQIDLVISLATERSRIKAYPGHIEQLLVNLLVNARDAMPDGGTLTIVTATVPRTSSAQGRHAGIQPSKFVRIMVADTGSGMSEHVKQHIFEPFFTTKAPGKGLGLGLATCYGIVKQHGGSIRIYSTLGQGTTVAAYFPCVE
jgi:two-component system cell cycle sensor histidine kinase/response regulator CckA